MQVTNACGIYIDGEFLCAVKNETDAATVFDTILDNYDVTDANAVVSFVEEISYVQGLYPDSEETIWDAQRLSQRLNSKKSAAQYYTVEEGDTVSGIAQKFGLSTATLFEQNPGLTEEIHIGQELLITREVNFIQVQVTRTETRTETIRMRRFGKKRPACIRARGAPRRRASTANRRSRSWSLMWTVCAPRSKRSHA